MSEHCPLRHPTATATRLVRSYDGGGRHIFLHIDDCEWAVKYLADELHTQGVSQVEDSMVMEDAPDDGDNIKVSWDFDSSKWRAAFLVGPRNSTHVFSSVDNITAAKWEAVAEADWGAFEGAQYSMLKEATRKCLCLQCSQMLASESS